MLEIRAKYIGEDELLGFQKGRVYNLEVTRNVIRNDWTKPFAYASVESFLKSWVPIDDLRGSE